MSKPQRDQTQERVRQLVRDKAWLLGLWVVTVILLIVSVLLLHGRITYLQSLLEGPSQQQVTKDFLASNSPRIDSFLVNIVCGIILTVSVYLVLTIFHFRNVPPADSEDQVFFNSRVARLFEKWSEDLPDPTSLSKLFAEAKVVEIYGITFFNRLIDTEEFPNNLRKRLEDSKKTTQILLLDPTGSEMKRRIEKSLPERDLAGRARRCHEILEPIAKEFPEKKFYLTFDNATTFAMLRFDDKAYVNLQLLAKCESSPGLEVLENGWLFPHYTAEFKIAWDKENSSASK
jgi:hypothetical protein